MRAVAAEDSGLTRIGARARSLCAAAGLLFCVAGVAGCHSAFVDTTIRNDGPPIRLIEVDYPSASFGTQSLGHAAEYHYRFKIQGSGSVSMQFEDADGKTHTVTGPELHQGQEGRLLIWIDQEEHVAWSAKLANAK